jgi:hypothetical protein
MPEDKGYLSDFGDYLRKSGEALGRIPEDVRKYWEDLPASSGDYGSALVGGSNYAADQATRIATRGNYGWPDVAKAFGGTGEASQENIDRFREAYAPVGTVAKDVGTFLGEGAGGGVSISPKAAMMTSEPAREVFANAALAAGSQRNMMIGPVGVENLFHAGRKAPKEAFKIADDLAAKGKGRAAIWDATSEYFRKHDPEFAGVHYGPDGMPRAELSDAGVPWTGATTKTLSTYGVDMTEPSKAWPHHTLYQAYPEMKDSGLLVLNPGDMKGSKNFASFDNINKSIALNLNPEHAPESMIAHETQHFGQSVDKTLGGSAPRAWTPKSSQVEKVLTGAGATPEFMSNIMSAAKEKFGFEGTTASELRKWASEQNLSIEDLAHNMSQYIGRDKYRRTYGETEARATQLRYHMTPEERRLNPPWESFDYPENKLITQY